MKSGKFWGSTEEIFNNGIVAIHLLKINKGGYCSVHKHSYKSNIFYVLKGNLKLSVWKQEDESDDTVLWEGEMTEVQPHVYHQFKGLTDVECLEIYTVGFKGEDIIRKTTGGVDEVVKKKK